MPGAGGTGGSKSDGPGQLGPPEKGKGKGKTGSTQAESTGVILVSLPAEARLTVDGQPTTSTSATRTLVSPNLQSGYEYTYTLRAEITRDGQTLAQTQRVAVRAGAQSTVSFDFSPTGVASAR